MTQAQIQRARITNAALRARDERVRRTAELAEADSTQWTEEGAVRIESLVTRTNDIVEKIEELT